MRNFLLAATMLAFAAPISAQGTMTPADVGAQPMTGTPSANYVAWAADGDMYEIQSSKLALTKGKSDAVKMHARMMIKDHTTTTRNLMAALPKTEPKVAKPPKALSEPNATKIAALRAASGDTFDQLYWDQQLASHQQAWALHKGYATDGADPALKQVAAGAVPIVEAHLQHLKSMSPNSGN
jgi:putative membrane protein